MIHVKRSRSGNTNDFATFTTREQLRAFLHEYKAVRRVNGKTGELIVQKGELKISVKVYDGNKLMRLHELTPMLPTIKPNEQRGTRTPLDRELGVSYDQGLDRTEERAAQESAAAALKVLERAFPEAPFAPPPAMPISAAPPGLPPPPTPNAGQDDPGADAGPSPEEERRHARAMARKAELNPYHLLPLHFGGPVARDIVRAIAVACHMTALLSPADKLDFADTTCDYVHRNVMDVVDATGMGIDEDEVHDIVRNVFEDRAE